MIERIHTTLYVDIHYFVSILDEKDLPYEMNCKSLLICGKKDQAGYTRKYNKKWHEETGIPIRWIENAGHNSNADKPEEINHIIEEFTFGDKR